MSTFEEANAKVHNVKNEWHYKPLTAAGYVPENETAVGFVRHYKYKHPDGHVITGSVGVNSDYWTDNITGDTGYWSKLQQFLNNRHNS